MELWQYKQLKQPKKSKYKAKRVVLKGEKFDSKAESKEWLELCERQRKGEIGNLYRQYSFALIPTRTYGTETVRGCKYIADFFYEDYKLGWVAQDTKGMPTEAYKVKKKIFLEKYVATGEITFIESGKEKKIYKKNEKRC